MIIAVDFDGTICTGTYPEIGSPMPYARDVINSLYDDGHYIIIWTCRTDENLLNAINWLLEAGFKFSRVNDHNPANLQEYGGRGGKKIYADCYIDDKNIGGFAGWLEAERIINEMEV